ncbi:unnamed protein product [Toxocara canis]|uniref:DCD domain-containing protein n=1 Tax=Toxocara canis TaxID=6265 RepID=A0A183UPN6_TOXCA|nr:unnamed protein product [Toxocara canis]
MNALIINARAATPTVAERMLLQREDVSATLWDGDSLLIYSCSEKGIDSLDNFSSGNIPAIRHQTFKAGPLRSPERERISLPLSILSTEMKHFEARNTFPNEMQKSEVDFLRDESERLLWEAEREIAVAAQNSSSGSRKSCRDRRHDNNFHHHRTWSRRSAGVPVQK